MGNWPGGLSRSAAKSFMHAQTNGSNGYNKNRGFPSDLQQLCI